MSHNGDLHFKEVIAEYEAEKVEEQEPDLEDDNSGERTLDDHRATQHESRLFDR